MTILSKPHWIAIAVISAALVALAWLWPTQAPLQRMPASGVILLEGEELKLSDWHGRAVLVNFWATSCRICLEEMPELMGLYEQYHPQGLEVLGIAMPYDRPDYVTEMKQDRTIPYPIALDPRGEAIRAFGNVRFTPTTFVFDPHGEVVYHRVGRIDFKELEDVIRRNLPAPNTAPARP